MTAYETVKKGLEEALAFSRGKNDGARVHEIELPDIDVMQIRRKPACRKANSPAASAWRRGRF